MTIRIDLDTDEADATLRRLGDFDRVFGPPMQRSLFRLQRKLASYPPPIPPGHWARNTSRRQKAAFFAALRAGRTSGRRDGTLGRKWTTDVSSIPDGLRGRIGNNTPYGPWVQSKQWQAQFHKGRWQTTEDVMRQEESNIQQEFREAWRREASR